MLQIKWNSNAIRETGWDKDNFDWAVNKSLIKELFLYSKLWFPNIKSSTSYINQSPVFEVKAWGVPHRKPGLVFNNPCHWFWSYFQYSDYKESLCY